MKPVTKRLTVSTKQQHLRQLRRPIRSTFDGRARPRRANDLILSPSDDLEGAKGRLAAQIGAKDRIEQGDLMIAMKFALRKLLRHNAVPSSCFALRLFTLQQEAEAKGGNAGIERKGRHKSSPDDDLGAKGRAMRPCVSWGLPLMFWWWYHRTLR